MQTTRLPSQRHSLAFCGGTEIFGTIRREQEAHICPVLHLLAVRHTPWNFTYISAPDRLNPPWA